MGSAILFVIAAEFFIQLINSTFMAILPLYAQQEGITDATYADFTSYRFLGVISLAFFVGIYIRNRKLKNLFYIPAIGTPLFGLLIIYGIHIHNNSIIYISHLLWGACFTFMQIPVLPFVMRNLEKRFHTGAIALSYATYSLASIFGGLFIWAFNLLDPQLFNERNLLVLISSASFISVWFIYKIKMNEHVPEYKSRAVFSMRDFDWLIVIKALIPTLIIAVGAGLTIPFISLFFANVHGMSTSAFSLVNAISAILVALASLLVPRVKQKIGYTIAVPFTQSIAVLALIILATTQFYSDLSISIIIAVIAFLLRQPLMNMAGPMTSELVMNYVGKRNQELVSALTSAIWSGSWYFSSRIFKQLRDHGSPYVNIFLITAAMYAIGVVWYYLLILDYNRKEKEGLIEK